MNFIWPNAKADEKRLFEAIAVLLGGDKKLLTFLFENNSPRLRKRAGLLKEDAWQFTDVERILLRAALDLWSGSGHVQLWEFHEHFDRSHWMNFIGAIKMLFQIDSDRNSAG